MTDQLAGQLRQEQELEEPIVASGQPTEQEEQQQEQQQQQEEDEERKRFSFMYIILYTWKPLREKGFVVT